MSPDSKWLAVRCADGMRVHDLADGRLVFEEPSIVYGYAPAFTPDGSRLAADPYDSSGRIIFWDVKTWKPQPSPNLSIGTILTLAFFTDGRRGAAGGFHGKVVVWDEG